jgi:hypothetical protein
MPILPVNLCQKMSPQQGKESDIVLPVSKRPSPSSPQKESGLAAKQTMTRKDEELFLDDLVGFACGSEIGKTPISSFGAAWF